VRLFQILLVVFALGAGLFGRAPEAKAWGEYGHLTVCDLAYRNLTDKAREELNKLLAGPDGRGVTVSRGDVDLRSYTSFNVGCLEEDERPRRHPKDHFLNLDRGTAVIASSDCPGGNKCILAGIDRDLAMLKDGAKPRQDRVLALMAIGHWVGDIHQPLHVSFADDAGGHGVAARLSGKCGTSRYRVSNLHGVWDNCLLEAGLFERVRKRADYKPTWGERTITYRAVDTLMANTTATEEKELVKGAPVDWANESLAITRQPGVLYCTIMAGLCRYSADQAVLPEGGQPRKQALSQDYLATYERVAEGRVRLAGFRLAHLLNAALDPAYTGPTANRGQRV